MVDYLANPKCYIHATLVDYPTV